MMTPGQSTTNVVNATTIATCVVDVAITTKNDDGDPLMTNHPHGHHHQ